MSESTVRIGVVGCGLMGAGIAQASADAGCDVRVLVGSEASLARGTARLDRALDAAVAKGRMNVSHRRTLSERIRLTTEYADLVDREFVFESIVEDPRAKAEVFRRLEEVLPGPDAVLATNTSSLTVESLARPTRRPGRVVGTHFFNPVPALPLVEVTGSSLTEGRTLDRVEEFLTTTLGKEVIRSQDRAGFVVNALLVPYLFSAMRMVESGRATAEDIDKGMTVGCAHPVGPLRLVDLVGLDTLAAVAKGFYEATGDPSHSAPAILTKMVAEGHYGKKSGRGFYNYQAQ